MRQKAACLNLTESLQEIVIGFLDMGHGREVGALHSGGSDKKMRTMK